MSTLTDSCRRRRMFRMSWMAAPRAEVTTPMRRGRAGALGGLRVLGRSFHPAGNGSFRHVEAEHPEFAMDARRTPTGIVSDHLKDQFTDLLGDPAATAHWF